ncbi:hypothetical protein [Pseudomonas sp. DWP3-1-2]|uniref:hypothetical protein n=1 Tax=Pseudomonas sp. DWP3-1-2 TaxID=2804645 RepID=UPI003CE9555D
MEMFFVLLMLCVLFWERGGDAKKELLKVVVENKRGLIKYLGSAALLAMTLSVLPSLLLSIYMRQHGFFAYEIFGSQQGGMRIISLNVLFNFIVLSVSLMGAAIFWKAKAPWPLVALSTVAALLVAVGLLGVAYYAKSYDLLVATLFFAFLIGGYVLFWISNGIDGKINRWWVPLVFSGIALVTPVIFHSYAAALAGNALFQMRVGGMPVVLTEPLGFGKSVSGSAIEGKLLLRTPELYYLEVAGENSTNAHSVVIVSSESASISYKFNDK